MREVETHYLVVGVGDASMEPAVFTTEGAAQALAVGLAQQHVGCIYAVLSTQFEDAYVVKEPKHLDKYDLSYELTERERRREVARKEQEERERKDREYVEELGNERMVKKYQGAEDVEGRPTEAQQSDAAGVSEGPPF